MSQKLSLRPVYGALYHYTGSDVHADVLSPWVDRHGSLVKDLLAPLATHGGWQRKTYMFGDLLEQAYALSRISDVLLLGFQPPLPPGVEPGWAHSLHLVDTNWPHVGNDQYEATFSALGMSSIKAAEFDPFFHEIVSVEQTENPDDPIEIVERVWPALMLGEMLFSRSGVRVRAGARNAVAGVADRSMLHEVFLRRHRDTSDGSLGWGSNSQWKTDFRRDYLTADVYHFNVDGEVDIDEADDQLPGPTPIERRDLLRHRCQIRALDNEEASPGRWRMTMPRRRKR